MKDEIPILGRIAVSIYAALLRLIDSKYLIKNKELKNLFAGKRIFIIATGPSIKEQNLGMLENEISISVSSFYLHEDFLKIKPKFHLFAASHPPITDEQYIALVSDAGNKMPKGQKVLVSITEKHLIEKSGAFENQKVYYYKLGHKPISAKIDFTSSLPLIQTSPQIATFLAFYLGASEIYLLGCDHDWILNFGKTRHFYSENQSSLTNSGYNEWQGKDFGNECEAYAHLWQVYRATKIYAEKQGIRIINSTKGGLLDVFPRKDLEGVLQENK
jgi:hypothetical protein